MTLIIIREIVIPTKDDDLTNFNNYRGISLINIVLLSKVVTDRVFVYTFHK